MENKFCKRCDTEREIDLFRLRKQRNKIYRVNICIFCERKQKSECEKLRYKNMDPDQKLLSNKRSKEYGKKESFKEWRRLWQKNKEKTDSNYKLKRRVGALLRNSINKNGKTSFEILGYNQQEIRSHLENLFEPWMNWDNWGLYNPDVWDDNDSSTWTWQIDHIIPVDHFNYTDTNDESFKQCWSLKNLRPLSAKENIYKRNKLS